MRWARRIGSVTRIKNFYRVAMNKRGLVTIAIVFIGLFVIFFTFSMVMLSTVGEGGFGASGNRVGVVEINGPIMESKTAVQTLRQFVKDESIKAIVVRVDSPGGAVGPSQEIYSAVKRAKVAKPLVVSMGGTAASGGYYIACGADTIYANPGTVTGSIGVITQLFNVQQLLDKAQVEVNTIKTGPYKDSGSPFKPFTEQDRAYFEQMIGDIYDQFVEDVAECRKLEIEQVKELADGRVYTGRQAKEYKLVDELGSLQDAIDHVAKEAKIDGEVKTIYRDKDEPLLGQLLKSSVQDVFSEVRSQTSPVVEYRMVGF